MIESLSKSTMEIFFLPQGASRPVVLHASSPAIFFAALPEEYRPFLGRTGGWRLARRRPFKAWGRRCGDKELLLVETGMGPQAVREAFSWTKARHGAALVVSAGFAGGLDPSLAVGDILLGVRFTRTPSPMIDERRRDETSREPLPSLPFPAAYVLKNLPSTAIRLAEVHGWKAAALASGDKASDKTALRSLWGDKVHAADMESYFLAALACESRLPFLCLRAISDGLRDAIGFDVRDIADGRGRVSIRKVARMAGKDPRVLKSFHQCWKRSRKAARSLAVALEALLTMPLDGLEPPRLL